MVDVHFKPYQKIVIHEDIEHKVRDLVRFRVTGARGSIAQPVVWVEGIVLIRTAFPPTDDIIKEQLEGTIHFSAIEWALMPKYRSALKSGGVTIPVINVNNNLTMRIIARALKKRHKET